MLASALACAQKMLLGSKVTNHIPRLPIQGDSSQRAPPLVFWCCQDLGTWSVGRLSTCLHSTPHLLSCLGYAYLL